MYLRLAFAVAAHLEPDILLVDEVLAVGDARFQRKCLGKMSDIAEREGRTVLFVSHNMGVIQRLCERSLLLEGGRLVDDGPTPPIIVALPRDDDVIGRRPELDRRFGGSRGAERARCVSSAVRYSSGNIERRLPAVSRTAHSSSR